MTDEHEERRQTIPGFTADQTWSVKQVIREAVSEGVKQGITEFQETNCFIHQKRTEAIETVVFGRTEAGVVGLDQRMASSEQDRLLIHQVMQRQEDDRKWTRRVFYSAIVVAGVGLIFNVIQLVVLGK